MRIAIIAGLLATSLPISAVASEWRPLFDGTGLSSWRGFKSAAVPTGWRVEGRDLTFDKSRGSGDLVSIEEFGDFELELEWKISEGGNSGILYFVQEADGASNSFSSGPEMQVLDDARHPDAKRPSRRAGSLYDLIPASTPSARPVGEWNAVRIVVRNGRIEHWLNGRKVVSTTYGDTAWQTLVAESKFRAMPHFAKVPRGRIALQDHDDRVWYRNIRIRTF